MTSNKAINSPFGIFPVFVHDDERQSETVTGQPITAEYVSCQRRWNSLNRHHMDTAKLPTRLHEFYPIDIFPMEGLPQDGEEDFYVLDKISDRIIQRLEDVRVFLLTASLSLPSLHFFLKEYTRKIFPAQVVITINTLPAYNSRSCPFWSCPSGSAFLSYSNLLTHLEHAHSDTVVHSLKLGKPPSNIYDMFLIKRPGATEKNDAIWKPSFLTRFLLTKAPKYMDIFRVCPESTLEVNDEVLRLSIFYNRMIENRVRQGLLTTEQAKERLRVNCRRLVDMPRDLPEVLAGANEFEQACLLLDGE